MFTQGSVIKVNKRLQFSIPNKFLTVLRLLMSFVRGVCKELVVYNKRMNLFFFFFCFVQIHLVLEWYTFINQGGETHYVMSAITGMY